jgi:hypothetical protein
MVHGKDSEEGQKLLREFSTKYNLPNNLNANPHTPSSMPTVVVSNEKPLTGKDALPVMDNNETVLKGQVEKTFTPDQIKYLVKTATPEFKVQIDAINAEKPGLILKGLGHNLLNTSGYNTYFNDNWQAKDPVGVVKGMLQNPETIPLMYPAELPGSVGKGIKKQQVTFLIWCQSLIRILKHMLMFIILSVSSLLV